MVPIIVLVTVIIFIIVDAILRITMKRIEEAKIRKKREEALDIGLRLDFSEETKSLKRVEVENPKARILAVDDEDIVLDSFRKILVLAGYSIDTVQSGPEALTLVKKHDYDFVFTDLKMPEMDGVEVVKAVKHLRPDIDVVVITGYATIESAVETMKFGAMDYVQKPFTEDELVDFVEKLVIRRQDRIDRTTRPKVHLITPSIGEATSKKEFNVPAGIFFSPAHLWVNVGMNGLVRVGLDDFTVKILETVDDIDLPEEKKKVNKGEPLFSISNRDIKISFPSPISGIIASVNSNLVDHLEYLSMKPYELGWICSFEPEQINEDIQSLKIGASTVNWYEKEIDKYQNLAKTISKEQKAEDTEKSHEEITKELWKNFAQNFINQSFD